MKQYPGMYRGIVEDVDDPQKRKRYRVRVISLHSEDTPVEALPWAEMCLFGGKGFGDLPAFLVGDRVWIQFEGADRRFPVILGGFLSEVGGVPDTPSEVRPEYATKQERWIRLDRVGNKIEMSPLPTERWIRLQTGTAEIVLRMNDGSIEVATGSQLRVTSPSVQVTAAEEVVVQTKRLFAQVDEEATIRCADTVNLQGSSVINIGRYEDPVSGALLPQTSDLVDVRANDTIKQESGGNIDIDAQQNITVDTQASELHEAQTEINLYGVGKAVLRSDGDVEVTAGGKVLVDATDNVEVSTDQQVTVDAATSVEVNAGTSCTIVAQGGNISIDSQGGNVSVQATGNVDVQATGNASVQSTGPLSMQSQAQIDISAPRVSISAQAQLMLDGGALAALNGGLVTIG